MADKLCEAFKPIYIDGRPAANKVGCHCGQSAGHSGPHICKLCGHQWPAE